MKTTIDISDPLLEAAKHAAAVDGITLKALVEAGLRTVLDQRVEQPPFRLRRATFAGNGLRPDAAVRSWDELRELAHRRAEP